MAQLPGIDTTKPKGRKDKDGGEKVISLKPLKDATKDLMGLYRKSQLSKDDYNLAAKAVAERAGLNTSAVKKLISSSYAGNHTEALRDAEQLSLVLSEVGEVATGAVTGGDTTH